MRHTDSLSKTEESILFVIDMLRCYSEHGFIASLYLRNYTEVKIQIRIAEIRQCLTIIHIEYLNLVEYSLRFNDLWATEDNNRYTTAERMLNMLKSSMESIKREFRKSCPISHAKLPDGNRKVSVFKDAVFTRGGCARDLFGIESFKDSIQTLFYEQRALFTNVLASLLVCRDVINKEKATKADRKRCAELLLKQCDEIIADMKNSIQYTQAPVTCEIQQLIDELGWEEAAQQGFHRFNLKEITEYALMRDANSRQAQVLSLDISKCQQKAADMRILFKYFDEFRPEPTRQKPSALKVLLIVNWMGGTCEWPIKQCYDLLAQNYKNALPTWHTVSTRKNQIPDLRDQQEKHDKELNAFIAEKKKQKSGQRVS